MTPLQFLGQSFDSEQDFRREFPAYAGYVALVRAGCDTPQKIEVELWRKNQRPGRKGARSGRVSKRRKAA